MPPFDPNDPTRRPLTPDPSAPLVVTMPPPPEVSIAEHGPSDQTTTTKLGPEYYAGAKTEQSGVDAQIAAQQNLKGIQENKGDADAKALTAEAGLMQTNADALGKAAAERQKRVDDRIAEYDRRIAERDKAAKPTSYFQDQGVMGTLFSHVLVGLSERSHRLAGGKAGQSPLQRDLDTAIETDTKRKMQAYEASKDAVESAKQGIDIERTAKLDHLADIKGQQTAAIDILIKKTKAYAAKLGTQEALAKADEEIGKLEEKKGALQAQRYEIAKTVTQHDSGSTTTTTNLSKDEGKQKPATASDAEKRTALQETERANREVAQIAKDAPEAVKQYQGAEREFAHRENFAKVPVLGPATNAGLSLLTGPTKDDWLGRMSPQARRLNELVETLATARAKALGGAVTEGDRATIKAQLGILGKTPKELAASASEYAGQATRQREALESVAAFPGAQPSSGTTSAQKDQTLSRLITLTGTRGAGKAAIEEAAKAARAAGWPPAVVDGLTRKTVK